MREQVLSVLEGRHYGEKIPRAAYSFLLPRGTRERRLRKQGWALFHFEKVCCLELLGIEQVEQEFWKEGKRHVLRRLRTPLGELTELAVFDSTYGSRWIKEFFVKEPTDYRTLEYIFEHTELHPVFDALRLTEGNLGDDGLVFAHMERSPFQRLLFDFTGPERLFVDLLERPDVVEGILSLLGEWSKEEYAFAASSPLDVIHVWDNITEDTIPPRLFERYCLPFYEQVAGILHKAGKLFAVHMDGKLQHLKTLIREAPIDIIESFTLPGAGGNLDLEEAQKVWSEKSIVANIPAYWCFEQYEIIQRELRSVLQVAETNRFMFAFSEDLPPQRMWDTLEAITEIMNNLF